MWLYRLQTSPNLALNPMEMLKTMYIELYCLNNVHGHYLIFYYAPTREIKTFSNFHCPKKFPELLRTPECA